MYMYVYVFTRNSTAECLGRVPYLVGHVVLTDRVRVAMWQEQLLKDARESVLVLDDDFLGF